MLALCDDTQNMDMSLERGVTRPHRELIRISHWLISRSMTDVSVSSWMVSKKMEPRLTRRFCPPDCRTAVKTVPPCGWDWAPTVNKAALTQLFITIEPETFCRRGFYVSNNWSSKLTWLFYHHWYLSQSNTFALEGTEKIVDFIRYSELFCDYLGVFSFVIGQLVIYQHYQIKSVRCSYTSVIPLFLMIFDVLFNGPNCPLSLSWFI